MSSSGTVCVTVCVAESFEASSCCLASLSRASFFWLTKGERPHGEGDTAHTSEVGSTRRCVLVLSWASCCSARYETRSGWSGCWCMFACALAAEAHSEAHSSEAHSRSTADTAGGIATCLLSKNGGGDRRPGASSAPGCPPPRRSGRPNTTIV